MHEFELIKNYFSKLAKKNKSALNLNDDVFFDKRKGIVGSAIGSIAETQEMIDYCNDKNIYPEVEIIPISKINEAFDRTINKDVRYRFVIDMSTL